MSAINWAKKKATKGLAAVLSAVPSIEVLPQEATKQAGIQQDMALQDEALQQENQGPAIEAVGQNMLMALNHMLLEAFSPPQGSDKPFVPDAHKVKDAFYASVAGIHALAAAGQELRAQEDSAIQHAQMAKGAEDTRPTGQYL